MKSAHKICSTNEDLERELHYLNEVFDVNNYLKSFVRNITKLFNKPTAVNETSNMDNTNEDKTVTATIPYVKGMSERIRRILKPYNILVAHKPSRTVQNVLIKVKDPSPKNSRMEAVYEIECAECPASYFGETRGTLGCRVKEHKRCIANKDTSKKIAVHHLETEHQMNWEGASCLEFASNYNKRMFLESWHTEDEKNCINICHKMPGVYLSLIRMNHDMNHAHDAHESRDHVTDAR